MAAAQKLNQRRLANGGRVVLSSPVDRTKDCLNGWLFCTIQTHLFRAILANEDDFNDFNQVPDNSQIGAD